MEAVSKWGCPVTLWRYPSVLHIDFRGAAQAMEHAFPEHVLRGDRRIRVSIFISHVPVSGSVQTSGANSSMAKGFTEHLSMRLEQLAGDSGRT